MLASQARRFGETLVDRHVLARDVLESALEECARSGTSLPALLLERKIVGSKDLTAALAESLGVRFVDFLETPLHHEAPLLLPEHLAREHLALGIDFEDRKLVVAFAEPADDAALAAVGQATGYEIIPAVADRAELAHALDMVFAAGRAAGGAEQAAAPARTGDDLSINELLDYVLQ